MQQPMHHPARPPAVNLSHLPPITQGTSAAIGSVISNAVVYPIDLLTTRIQTTRLTRRVGKNQRPTFNRQSSLTSELSTTSAGSANRIPKDYSSITSAIYTIICLEEPSQSWIVKFYNGILIDSIATLINSFIYFYIYTNLNKLNGKYKKQKNQSLNRTNKIQFNWIRSTVEEILIGSLTGIISKAFTCPLNNITIRFQTRRLNAKKSLSRSSLSSSKKIKSIQPSNYHTNEKIHNQSNPSNVHSELLIGSMLSSSSPSSSSSSSSSLEGENDKNESKLGRRRKVSYVSSLIATMRSIYRDRGWAGFWSGFGNNCILSLNPSLSLYLTKVINLITRKVMDRLSTTKSTRINESSLLITFLSSALGSCLSTILTYPLMLSKTLIQSNVHPTRRQTSLIDRHRTYGSKALYTGLSAKLIKVFLAQGITMTIKNWIETRFISIWIAFSHHHHPHRN